MPKVDISGGAVPNICSISDTLAVNILYPKIDKDVVSLMERFRALILTPLEPFKELKLMSLDLDLEYSKSSFLGPSLLIWSYNTPI